MDSYSDAAYPLLIYAVVIAVIIGAILFISHLLGGRRHEQATDEPFESGIVPVGDARLKLSVPFYLVAILFVVFDLEAMFLFAWAVSFREAGLYGFIEAAIFIAVLAVALVYLFRMKALDWGGRQKSLNKS